ncbi:MAG: hypothetical protein ACOYJL_03060 [Tractidigestivibacter sp.]|jgi:hypothetical protein|uniref:hypothetical protein n=1 Tax=Tractidigestivibacter sp. TaxID=2847320 RepID=UPI003D8D7514
MMHGILAAVAVGMPVLAAVVEWLGSIGISERHHSHHDTFVISAALTHSIALAMVFMGVTGMLLVWLCEIGVFRADSMTILAFFSTFILVSFVAWLFLRRYRVSLYDDFMDVRPFVGNVRSVIYDEIESMEWTGLRTGSGYRDLVIYEDGEKYVRIPGMLNIEQILMRIDRYDVLARQSDK